MNLCYIMLHYLVDVVGFIVGYYVIVQDYKDIQY